MPQPGKRLRYHRYPETLLDLPSWVLLTHAMAFATRVGCPDQTEDLMHDIVVALLLARQHYDPSQGSWSAYATPRLHGALRDTWRTWQGTRRVPGMHGPARLCSLEGLAWHDPKHPARLPDPALDLETATIQRQQRERLSQAMAALPARERDIAERYYLHGETMATIAAAVGCDVSRISQLHARLVRRLRASLDAPPHS